MARYNLFGFPVQEHSEDNRTLNPDEQHVTQAIVVYTTDDVEEAKGLIRNGGYVGEKDNRWVAIQWGEDSATGGVMGNKPQTVEAYAHNKNALNKKDF